MPNRIIEGPEALAVSTTTPIVRHETHGGRRVVVVERTPPLPSSLDKLLGALFAVRVRNDIRPTGASAACEQWRTHRFTVLREARHFGLDRVLRDLRIDMCADCGAVCVRDISVDRSIGTSVLNKRDLVLGWYSGTRRGQRQYL